MKNSFNWRNYILKNDISARHNRFTIYKNNFLQFFFAEEKPLWWLRRQVSWHPNVENHKELPSVYKLFKNKVLQNQAETEVNVTTSGRVILWSREAARTWPAGVVSFGGGSKGHASTVIGHRKLDQTLNNFVVVLLWRRYQKQQRKQTADFLLPPEPAVLVHTPSGRKGLHLPLSLAPSQFECSPSVDKRPLTGKQMISRFWCRGTFYYDDLFLFLRFSGPL